MDEPKFLKSTRIETTESVSVIGDLVVRAANQLVFAGPGATATVQFAVDGQWFDCTLAMIDESEVQL